MNYRLLPLVAVIALTAVACATKQYIISTKEGRMLEAHGKPTLDETSGLYSYKDSDGKLLTIPKGDVIQILRR